MRVAQLEMKMALARLFRTFSLMTCAETEVGCGTTPPPHSTGASRIQDCLLHDAEVFFLSLSSQDPLELKSFSTLGPKNGIFVKIQRRDMNQGSSSTTAEH